MNKNFKKFIKFCIVGGIAFVIDIGFFNVFLLVNLPFVVSRAFAIILSFSFNFTINRNITFLARKKSIRKQIWKYLIVYLVASLINMSIGWIIVSLFGDATLISNVAALSGILVQIPITFFGLLFWVFKSGKNSK